MVCIGNLTHTAIPLDTGDIIFNMKIVAGLILNAWILSVPLEER